MRLVLGRGQRALGDCRPCCSGLASLQRLGHPPARVRRARCLACIRLAKGTRRMKRHLSHDLQLLVSSVVQARADQQRCLLCIAMHVMHFRTDPPWRRLSCAVHTLEKRGRRFAMALCNLARVCCRQAHVSTMTRVVSLSRM